MFNLVDFSLVCDQFLICFNNMYRKCMKLLERYIFSLEYKVAKLPIIFTFFSSEKAFLKIKIEEKIFLECI